MTANKPEVEVSEPVVAEGEVVEAPPKVKEGEKSADGATNEAGTSGDSREESLRKAVNALVQGKRHFFMKDIPSAIAALEESCRLQVDIYGPLSSEHAEAHFYFGRALLEQARIDLTVFDAPNAGGKSEEETSEGDDDMEDEEGDDDDEEDEEMAEEANDGTTTTSVETNKEKLENGTAKDSSSNGNNSKEEKDAKPADTKMDETANPSSSGSSNTEEAKAESSSSSSAAAAATTSAITANDDEKPSTSKGGDMSALAEAGEEELNNLELAWEVLEIAKLGYQKQLEQLETKLSADNISDEENPTLKTTLEDIKRKLADTHSYLGEVGTESEIYPQAVEDFKTALSIYSELEGADSREIAQIKFHIGVTYALEKKWKESVENLQDSAQMIQVRIDNLKEKLTKLPENKSNGESTTTASSETVSERTTIEKEIQELSELLPELQEKINDTLEQERDLKRVEEEDKMEQEVIERNSPVKQPPPAKPLDSGLIKRKEKRKVELESVPLGQVIGGATKQAEFGTDEPPTKKPCTESSSAIDKQQQQELPASLATETNGHKKPE